LATINSVALPLAFAIARRPGTAVITEGLQLALLFLGGVEAIQNSALGLQNGALALLYLAGALAFELVFLAGRYQRYSFWRLIVASVLTTAAARVTLSLIYGQPLSFEMTFAYNLAGAALGGCIAYLIGRMVRR
jgi:ABC-type thiamin/hydroxymethylpyrimidine transport system permease subunit